MNELIKVQNNNIQAVEAPCNSLHTKDHYVNWTIYNQLLMDTITERSRNLIALDKNKQLEEKCKNLQKLIDILVNNVDVEGVVNAVQR